MSTIERSVKLTVGAAEALSYFTEPRSLATIFAAERAEVEPREGGPFELYWRSGDSTKGCTITRLVEGEALSAEFTAPTEHRDLGAQADGSITVRVRDEGDGSVAELAHDVGDGGDAREYFEKRWDEWAHNLQVLAFSDEGGEGTTEKGPLPRYDLDQVELTRIPNLIGMASRNVEDQL